MEGNIAVAFFWKSDIITLPGVLAQLEARIAGSDEVTGSNPVSSTIDSKEPVIHWIQAFLFYFNHKQTMFNNFKTIIMIIEMVFQHYQTSTKKGMIRKKEWW